ncbi:hypothetical protein HLB44_11745 [Aquincola sp. S2]|uniref:Dockerin domain-containing protein n=1 Tax=Pseudaquabacterium terrae TaxID=2732868 RepID=A0ABX2EGB2_9BURK|nr:hypothetical protein [Aquabacterium terrae]NRF67658.1 hypothetical protein [Aquabacterium terrae]
MTHRHAARFPTNFRWSVTAIALAIASTLAGAAGKTYTLDADFDLGVLSGVNHNAPNNNQLQISAVGTTFPVMWIANGGEDTLSKIDTNLNKEIGRYRTWFGPSGQPGFVSHVNNPFAGPAPSRTAVDLDGNAYVANRWFQGDRQAWVLKILAEGSIDRNGNGVVDTSTDTDNNGQISLAEMKPMADNAPANNRIDVAELQDERIAWAVSVGPNNGLGRSLCIGTDGHLWVGLYNAQQYWKISSVDGSVLAGPIAVNWTPYGCLVDGNNVLWSASLANVLGKITNTHLNAGHVVSSFIHGGQNYGIALGHDRVFLGLISGASYTEFNPATNAFIFPADMSFAATGISVDATGDIVSGPFGSGGVTKFRWSTDPALNGNVIWTRPSQIGGTETRGVIVDSNNDVWQVSRTGNVVMKYRGTDGLPLGVFPVGNHPYTYSDATGLSQRTQTNPTGTWTVVFDGGAAATPWGKINWTDAVPAGASVQVEARTADTQAALSGMTYQPVSKNVQFAASGRFIQIQTRLNANTNRDSPILFDLTVNSLVTVCDVDGDTDVDSADLNLIRAAIGQAPTANDPRDANADGKITINDVRACTLVCTRAGCGQ